MTAELGEFEQPRQGDDGALAHVQTAQDVGEVLERRLGTAPREPVTGERPLHERIGCDHRPARILLATQVVDRRLDRAGDVDLEAVTLEERREAAAPHVHPDAAQQDEAADAEYERPLEMRLARRRRGEMPDSVLVVSRTRLRPLDLRGPLAQMTVLDRVVA